MRTGGGASGRSETLRVLIVDDEEHVLLGLDAVLSETFRTITCSDPAVAVQIASTQPIDVLCADYSMPSMNGLELVETLARTNDVIAAVLITGQIEAYLEEASRRMAREGRPLAVLAKPCDPRELIRAVERVGQFARMRRAVSAMRKDVRHVK
jgi:CheY-like chemotaxis protein